MSQITVPSPGERVTCWNYDFTWSDRHLTPDQLRPHIYTYDTSASELLDRLDEISPPPPPPAPADPNEKPQKVTGEARYMINVEKDADGKPKPKKAKRDLYQILYDNRDKDDVVKKFWEEVTTVPEWVDWKQIERGQKVFLRHGGPAIVGLTFQSLLGGMASSRTVETLTRTGGFGERVTRHRLIETFQHVLQASASLPSIQPPPSTPTDDPATAAGFASTLRVRLLHASVRRRILALAAKKPEYYSVNDLGVPVNDLDCIATVVSFAPSLVFVGFPRQGIWLSRREIEDYMALWRWVAFLLGTPQEPFANPDVAKVWMESLLVSEMHPGEKGAAIANNIISALHAVPPMYASRKFLCAQARWLNGDDLADRLKVERPGLYYKTLMAAQCLFFMAVTYPSKMVPVWDETRIRYIREYLFDMTIRKKEMGALGEPTTFDFKFIPSIQYTATPLGYAGEAGIMKPGIERRNFMTLMAAMSVVGMASWMGLRGVHQGLVRWQPKGIRRGAEKSLLNFAASAKALTMRLK